MVRTPYTKDKHLLLINPWIYDFAAYDLWAKPLGLLTLASLLKENDWTIHYIDCLDVYHPALKTHRLKRSKRRPDHRGHFYQEEVEKPASLSSIPRRFYRFGFSPEIFREVLQSLPIPQVILVTSGMTYWYRGVHEAIGIVKEIFPSVPVILGGIYATLCAGHAERSSGADFVIQGWGEIAILQILEELTGVSPFFVPELNDLDTFPPPAFDLYPHLDYYCVLTSRGCPFQCTYCASPLLNPRFITRDPAYVVNEMASWADRGVEDIAFYDDALLADHEFAIALLQGLRERESKVRFHAPNGLHARGVTQEVAYLMR